MKTTKFAWWKISGIRKHMQCRAFPDGIHRCVRNTVGFLDYCPRCLKKMKRGLIEIQTHDTGKRELLRTFRYGSVPNFRVEKDVS